MSLNIGMKTHISILQEYLLRIGHVPQYDLVRDDTGTHIPIFTYRLEVGEHTVEGTGDSKKEAKQRTAELMLAKLNINGQESKTEPQEALLPLKKMNKFNAVGALTDYCVQMKMGQAPIYHDVREEGPPHAKLFTVRCNVAQLSETAIAGTKKQAKQLAAQQMLDKLKSLEIISDENVVTLPDSLTIEENTEINPELVNRAIQHFKELRNFTAQYISGINVSQYHKVFKSDSVVIPEAAIKLVSNHSYPNSLELNSTYIVENYETILTDVTTEMNVIYTFSDFPYSEISQVLLNVNHSPPVTFIGRAKTKDVARKNAIIDYLHYLCVLIA